MKVAVIGMGYVGIQLAIEIGRHYETIGFDFDIKKLGAYKLGIDPTGEINRVQFDEATNLQFTNRYCFMKESQNPRIKEKGRKPKTTQKQK